MATSLLSRLGHRPSLATPLVKQCQRHFNNQFSFTTTRRFTSSTPFRYQYSPDKNVYSLKNGSFTRHRHIPSRSKRTLTLLASSGIVAGVLGFSMSDPEDDHVDDSEQYEDNREPKDWPRYRLTEVKLHDGKSDRPWLTWGDKVYDITDWIPGHPGGEVILQAAGGAVEPFWDIFTIHKAPHVRDILEQYVIGYVHSSDLVDGKIPLTNIEDPFSRDPIRDPALRTLTARPRNAETPAEALAADFETPNPLFYVRNHFWVPVVNDAPEHTLTIELPDGDIKTYTLAELKTKFPSHTLTATLQCSGNRRNHMTRETKATNGLQWTTGGISTATWTGVRLCDVLADAGYPVSAVRSGEVEPPEDAQHTHFSALEAYGASIPTAVAIEARNDVLLAYGMNGTDLPRDHGYPLRALVPGHVAARSVKWLSKITLSNEESPSQWQRKDYKTFGPNVDKPDWSTAPSIQEMPVTSAVTSAELHPPAPSSPSTERPVSVKGYAYSGGGRAITRVDISLDGGTTWTQARLIDDDNCQNTLANHRGRGRSWAWKRWEYDGLVKVAPTKTMEPSTVRGDLLKAAEEEMERKGVSFLCSPDIVVKATDESYNTQPQTQASVYNTRGNLATAWHRVRACEQCANPDGKTGQSQK